jgi:membrane-associated protease RseP (regulator of RpoE activity)
MSLTFGPFGPVAVAAKEVDAKPDGNAWTCTVAQGAGGPRGRGTTFRVVFDAHGRCSEATHKYNGPLPICIGGLFRPVATPSGMAGLGHDISGILEVDSVDKNSIAERAGLKSGDLIVSFDGRPLPSRDVIQQMRQVVYVLKQQGNVARSIRVVRNGELVDLTLRW